MQLWIINQICEKLEPNTCEKKNPTLLQKYIMKGSDIYIWPKLGAGDVHCNIFMLSVYYSSKAER